MKVAFISQPFNRIFFPNPHDSLGIWTAEIARHLAHSCEIVVYTPGERKKVCHESVNYHYIPVALDKLLLKFLKRSPSFSDVRRPLFASKWYYLGYILQIANDLRSQQCDVVHIHNFPEFAPIIRFFNPNIKIVLHMHCEWLTQLDRSTIAKYLQSVDLIVGCSEYITEKIRQRFPEFANCCQAIDNGVDVERFVKKAEKNQKAPNRVKELLFVGRVIPEKGIHVLLEAFQKVVDRDPEVQLKIVGQTGLTPYEFVIALSDDPKVSELATFYNRGWKDYLSRWQNSANISFLGHVSHAHLASHYSNADIFIFPSVWQEPFGMPIIEAMSCEIPVIATHSGAFPEIVTEGKTGLLVERDDANALAEAILCLLADEDLRKSMGKAGRQRVVEIFSLKKISDRLLSHYQRLFAKRDRRLESDAIAQSTV
jgi:glycosyltransferase involved in cell wall biosynthesis